MSAFLVVLVVYCLESQEINMEPFTEAKVKNVIKKAKNEKAADRQDITRTTET